MKRDDHFVIDHIDGAAQSSAVRGWRPVLGAGLSLCLLGGLVVWTYQLGVRDATEVPVIRAMAGEMRMRPEDPGGARFAHQDRAVYAVIDPQAAVVADPALAAPVEPLADEDLPAGKLLAAALEPPAPSREDLARAEAADPAAPDAAPPIVVEESLASREPAPDAVDEVDRLVAMVLDEADAAPVIRAAFVSPGAAAPRVSPAAPPRPAASRGIADERRIAVERVAQTAAAPAPQPVAARPQGAQLQLGAYLTEGDANRMWSALRARNGDLMAGREVAIFPVETEGRTLWLLRAGGFGTASDAGAMCGALKARGEECFVVRGG